MNAPFAATVSVSPPLFASTTPAPPEASPVTVPPIEKGPRLASPPAPESLLADASSSPVAAGVSDPPVAQLESAIDDATKQKKRRASR